MEIIIWWGELRVLRKRELISPCDISFVPDLMGILSSEQLIKISCQFITEIAAKPQHLKEELFLVFFSFCPADSYHCKRPDKETENKNRQDSPVALCLPGNDCYIHNILFYSKEEVELHCL